MTILKDPIHQGLHTYQIKNEGRDIRIHLSVGSNGSGKLFIDVTDVIHLNETGIIFAKAALDGINKKMFLRFLKREFIIDDPSDLIADVDLFYGLIEHIKNHPYDCMTCDLVGKINMQPLFSINTDAPYKVDLAITYGCNNKCSHCYNEPDRFDLPSLTIESWKLVVDKLEKLGVPHLILTGGEATLFPGLFEIIKHANNKGMIVGLNSNGRLLANETYMRELAASGLNHVQVTLGSEQEQLHNQIMNANSFRQTIRGIKTAIESGVFVITNTTLMQSNKNDVEKIIDFLFELGIRTFAMNGMIFSGGGYNDPNAIPESEIAPILVRVRDHAKRKGMKFLWYTPTEYCRLSPVELDIGVKRCNAAEYSLCIEPNGDVLPCQSYYVSAGNILHDPWEKIWHGELFKSFRDRNEYPEKYGLAEKCWHCPDLYVCGGGCRIEREARDGVRVSTEFGGGCSGCNPVSGTKATSVVGFVPKNSLVNSKVRSSGLRDEREKEIH